MYEEGVSKQRASAKSARSWRENNDEYGESEPSKLPITDEKVAVEQSQSINICIYQHVSTLSKLQKTFLRTTRDVTIRVLSKYIATKLQTQYPVKILIGISNSHHYKILNPDWTLALIDETYCSGADGLALGYSLASDMNYDAEKNFSKENPQRPMQSATWPV